MLSFLNNEKKRGKSKDNLFGTANYGQIRTLGNRVNLNPTDMFNPNAVPSSFNQSFNFDTSNITNERNKMRSSRLKKRSKMVISMVRNKSNTHRRSKSRSRSKTKDSQIENSYRKVKSKSRSVPK